MFSSIPNGSALFYSLIGGILPALIWLWFWTQEDKLHPEPRGRLLWTFIAGMIAVPLVYYPQRWTYEYFGSVTPTMLIIWAAIEEVAKYIMVYFFALCSRDFDEPVDAMTYMITGALGFAALENTLFILNPFLTGEPMQAIFMAGNMRFIGASLVHVISSGVLGYCIGREFFRPASEKQFWRIFGLILATGLHAVFNLFIMYENGSNTFLVFSGVWMAGLILLLLFENVKQIQAK